MADRAPNALGASGNPGLRAAGPFARGLALAIDELLRWLLIATVAIELATLGISILSALLLAACLIYVGYGALFEAFGGGATPGKRALGLRVVTLAGEPAPLWRAAMRNAVLPIDMLPFGYVLGLVAMMTTTRFRRVGDLAAGTQVIYREPDRQPWEAPDDGCLVVRRRAASLYVGWFATALPIFVLCAVWFRSSPGVAGLLLWWLKPVYERIPLWLANEHLLGREASLGDAISHWRDLTRGLAAYSTYRRLSPTRSFDAPIAVLEGLRGAERRTRVWLLHRRGHAQAMWLTIIGAHVEAFVLISAIVLALPLFAGAPAIDWQRTLLAASDGRLDWASNLLYLFAIGVVGPVYAVAGLTAYRSRLEELRGEGGRAMAAQ